MKLPTAYDPFYLNQNQGLRKGRISVNPTAGIDASLAVRWYNSQESGDDYILITDNYSTGRTSNINDGTPLFYPMGRTQANILTTVNGLRNSPKGFTSSGSALEFVARAGYFIIDPYNPPPQMVTSGSIVNLDARQIMSFPTTGSGWYDMSGWSNNAILTTCSFSSSAITFPSPASAVTINYITQSTEGMTISFNARMKKPLAAITSSLGNGNVNVINSFSQSIGQTVVKYNNIACTFEASATSSTLVRKIYVNGDLTSENTINAPFDPIGAPSYVNIFTDNGAGSNSLQNVQMYQRVLSQDEILQNYYQGGIVTSDLVVALDAGNILSYPASGSTWYDLSGNGNDFTLYNGVGFSVENGGCLTFDGLDDYIASTSTLNLSGYDYIAVEVFYKCNTTSAVSMLFEHTANWNSNTGGFGMAVNSNGSINLANCNHTNHNTEVARNYLVTNNLLWSDNLNLYSKIADTTGRLTYLNGGLIPFSSTNGYPTTTITTAGGSFANSTMYIGSRGGSSIFFNGNISSLKIYGFKINASQVNQNFNAYRTRFNI